MKTVNDWTPRLLLAAAMTSLAFGCALDDGSSDEDAMDTEVAGDDASDDGSTPSDDGGAGAITTATVYEIQQGMVPENTTVRVENLVVTTPVHTEGEDSNGAVIVQEMAGGEYSGIYLYLYDTVVSGVPLNEGDVVNITGEYAEFMGSTQMTIKAPSDIEVVSSGPVPEPSTVTPDQLVGDAAEAWENVLVTVADLNVEGYDEFCNISTQGPLVDNLWFQTSPQPGSVVGMTGVVRWAFEAWRISPRYADDVTLVDGSFDAVAQEITSIQNSDGESSACTPVLVEEVVVTTPVDPEGDTFFVQEPEGGKWSGVPVFLAGDVSIDVQPGDIVTISAGVDEYFDLTQLVVTDASQITKVDSGEPLAPIEVSAADVATGGPDQEAYEGVLVTVTDVSVTAGPDEMYNEWTLSSDLLVDDLFFLPDPAPAVDDAYASITGVMSYGFMNARLLPRSAEDLVPAE